MDKLYTAINLQNGRYQLDDVAPNQFTSGGRVASNNIDIQQHELDVLAGYYFWETVSLFLDLKGVSITFNGSTAAPGFKKIQLTRQQLRARIQAASQQVYAESALQIHTRPQ